MPIAIESNLEDFLSKGLGRVASQLPFAVSRAVNDTGADVLAMLPRLMEEVFDRPTPYARGAFTLYRGDKADPVATVMRKPDALRRRFLEVEAQGGPRGLKGFERRMDMLAEQATGVAGAYAVPARAAQLDGYGNWSSAQRNRVLSDLRITGDAATYASKASRKRSGRQSVYFVPKNAKTPGVYKRVGKRITLILLFVRWAPTYAARFPMQERSAELARKRFPVHMQERLAQAMSSAR